MAFGIIKRRLKEKAVYYPPLGEIGTGNLAYGEPQEIDCRWEEINEEYKDYKGETKVSKARVGILNRLKIGGILIYGKLDDLPDPDNPKNNPGWATIQGERNIPTLKATQWYREVYL